MDSIPSNVCLLAYCTYLPFVGCVATHASSLAFVILDAGVVGMLALSHHCGEDQSGESADGQDERAGETHYDKLMIWRMC